MTNKTKLGQPAVHKQIDQVIPPATTKTLCLAQGCAEPPVGAGGGRGAVFVPVMMAPQKPEAAKRSALPSITIETAGIVVRAERSADIGWLAAMLRVVKALS
jgi:hypothetical protein